MRATTRFRDEVMRAFDEAVRPRGYSRRRSHTFRAPIRPGIDGWLHLNWGLSEKQGRYSIHPSVGVRVAVIEEDLIASGMRDRDSTRPSGTFAQMLQVLSGRDYEGAVNESVAEVAGRLFDDWIRLGEPAVSRMADLSIVVAMLRSKSPREWCCSSRSDRARLLPLALWHSGAQNDALAILPQLEEDVRGRDQLLPEFAEFRRWFEVHRR
jgi:hypothetical protein